MGAQAADGQPYAAAPVKDEAGWGFVYKDDHEESIMQDDMSEVKMTINEATAIQQAVEKGSAGVKEIGGLWVGGLKYTITGYEANFESGDYTFVTVFANRPKMGIHMVKTDSQIVAGLYDEGKNQTSGNCKKSVIAFAEYLKGLGY